MRIQMILIPEIAKVRINQSENQRELFKSWRIRHDLATNRGP